MAAAAAALLVFFVVKFVFRLPPNLVCSSLSLSLSLDSRSKNDAPFRWWRCFASGFGGGLCWLSVLADYDYDNDFIDSPHINGGPPRGVRGRKDGDANCSAPA